MKPPDFTWDELDAIRNQKGFETLREPGEFTVMEYARKYEMDRSVARHQIGKLVDAGRLTERKARVNGRICGVFKLVKKTK